MVVDTRKSNATKHPGNLLMASKQQRQTKAQIEKDETRTKAAAIAAKEDAIAKHQAILKRVADIEESIGRDKEAIRAYANRPDRCNSSKYLMAAGEKTTNLE